MTALGFPGEGCSALLCPEGPNAVKTALQRIQIAGEDLVSFPTGQNNIDI